MVGKLRKWLWQAAVSLAVVLCLAGCSGGEEAAVIEESSSSAASQESSQAEEAVRLGRVYYLNFKPEVEAQWQAIAKAYQELTGVEVVVETAAEGQYEQELKTKIHGEGGVTLFQVNGPVGYDLWKAYCMDLTDSALYRHLVDQSMAVKGEDGGVYAIPYTVEAYGLLYNQAILDKYFALEGALFTHMEEISGLEALEALAKDMDARKQELGIEGVFASTSLRLGEDWRWHTHLANLPIYYEYKDKNVADLPDIEFSYQENFRRVFDLYLDYGVMPRETLGDVDVAASMMEFALGKCAMVQNGNWAWGQISSVAGNVVQPQDIKMLPIYFGVDDANQGLCMGTENYWCLNKEAAPEDIVATMAFTEWLITSQEGKAFMYKSVDEGGLGNAAPFDTFGPGERSQDPLSEEMFRHMAGEVDSMPWVFRTFPSQHFKDHFGASLLAYAKGSMPWEEVCVQVVEQWKLAK